MAVVNVYQYDYFDRVLKCERRSADFATADAISALGARALAESVRALDEKVLDENGFIKAKDLPPRPIPPAAGERRRWMRPEDDARAGRLGKA